MSKTLKITLWVVVVLFVVFVILPPTINKMMVSPGEQAEISAQEEKEANLKDAYVYARQLVKPTFKVPSSVEFQPAYEVVPVDKGDNTYDMTFWVLAQNIFGVNVKTTYNVVVKKTYDNKWEIKYMLEVK